MTGYASRPNGTSRSQWPGSEIGNILLTTAMDMREDVGRLSEGVQTLQAHTAEMRDQLSEHGAMLARLDQQVESLATASAKVVPPAPAPSGWPASTWAPLVHLAAMVMIAGLGLAGVISGAETKQALIGAIPK
ncbi:MAG: hypothetical protein ACOYLQ_09365 [Hyphomicrobiaceae bacterium]